MNTIRNLGLGIIALVLAGCGENPMLKPQAINDLKEEITQHSSLKDRIACVEYATNPNVFNLRQSHCSSWMQDQYKNYASQISVEMAAANIGNTNSSQPVEKTVPTYKEFSDPAVWQMIWNEQAEKWEQELATQNLNAQQALLAAEQAKLLKAQAAKPKPPTVAPVPVTVPAPAAKPAPAKCVNNCVTPQKATVHKRKQCIKSTVCERFPQSMACQRIRNAAVRNGIYEPIC